MDRQSQLQGFLRKATSLSEIEEILERITADFGFRQYALMNQPRRNATLFAPLLHLTSLPKKAIARYDHYGLMSRSAIRHRSEQSFMPFQWTFAEIMDRASRQSLLYTRLMARFRLTMGIGFTFTGSNHGRLALYFIGDRKRLERDEQNELAMIALKAFSRFDDLHRLEAPYHALLSNRETEVAGWTAEGKTSSEIAGILGLSEHTVNAYLSNAIRKLDCVNRVQLIAKAIRYGIIP